MIRNQWWPNQSIFWVDFGGDSPLILTENPWKIPFFLKISQNGLKNWKKRDFFIFFSPISQTVNQSGHFNTQKTDVIESGQISRLDTLYNIQWCPKIRNTFCSEIFRKMSLILGQPLVGKRGKKALFVRRIFVKCALFWDKKSVPSCISCHITFILRTKS